ncbi:CLUMA_CG001778, isoform A [Clunio marinus]|uniref:Pre-mRNA-splicing factor SYF2 n=1 Tax=Clunio marinus TaxID=568069 RepID=A0A1J1HIW3_9DIPT|nr:CLUMA_CG001778, isoform A [Clunio marinus]
MSDTKATSTSDKMKERMAKLKNLHNVRNEARNQNHSEVKKEMERMTLPKNWDIRQQKAEWLIKDKANRDDAEEKGMDYDRVKLLNVSAQDQERIDKIKKRNKKIGDQGFADYETQTARQYQRLVKAMPAKDLQRYNEQKEMIGDNYYSSNPILEGVHKDSKAAVNNMVKDLDQQIEKRKKFSRRRMHNDEADIDYINEKNRRLNKKLAMYYDPYTTEIKQALERGTAI